MRSWGFWPQQLKTTRPTLTKYSVFLNVPQPLAVFICLLAPMPHPITWPPPPAPTPSLSPLLALPYERR